MVTLEKKPTQLNRSRIDIIAHILNTTETATKKTHIMYQCNLSFRQLNTYLELLTQKNLITQNDDNTYQTTNQGQAFIQAYKTIKIILSS